MKLYHVCNNGTMAAGPHLNLWIYMFAQTAQDAIAGWGITLEGCIATWWRKEKDQYLKAFKSR